MSRLRLRYCQKHWPAAGSALGTIPLWWKTPIHGTRSKPFWPCCRSLSAFKHGWKPPPFGELFCCFCFIGAASKFRFLCLRRHDMRVVLRNSWTAPCQPLTTFVFSPYPKTGLQANPIAKPRGLLSCSSPLYRIRPNNCKLLDAQSHKDSVWLDE